jgi:ABC-type multidrug transport system fused ATPase/permease subunit
MVQFSSMISIQVVSHSINFVHILVLFHKCQSYLVVHSVTNLDPFEIYTDEACLSAPDDVQFKHRVRDHSHGLYLPVAEMGSNFSVGECQLIFVARAILKKSKILLIDEATANIDHDTDASIQAVISDKFWDRTILTIAHRLNTIAKSDRILVMERGRVGNFDTPQNILQQH